MKNIHLVPTDKLSRLADMEGLLVFGKDFKSPIGHPTMYLYKHIYITSDEEIKEGDAQYDIDGDISWAFGNDSSQWEGNKKIILTTDTDLIADGVQAIDDEFLEWFVKNPNCEYVEFNDSKVVKEHIFDGSNDGEIIWEKKIIIPQEEPKQAPFLEADNIDGEWLSPVPEERAWQEENLKKIFESYPNAYPKWGYLNGLILLGLKRIEIINKKNQNIDDLEEPKQETLTYSESLKKEERIFNSTMTKQETLEEAAVKYATNHGMMAYVFPEKRESFIDGAKWQAERMYSEEDMISFATWLSNISFNLQHFNEKGLKPFNELFPLWQEQHKKK